MKRWEEEEDIKKKIGVSGERKVLECCVDKSINYYLRCYNSYVVSYPYKTFYPPKLATQIYSPNRHLLDDVEWFACKKLYLHRNTGLARNLVVLALNLIVCNHFRHNL
jgi:hypothetical protein